MIPAHLLWKPYILLGTILVSLTIASFLRYHFRLKKKRAQRGAILIQTDNELEAIQGLRSIKRSSKIGAIVAVCDAKELEEILD